MSRHTFNQISTKCLLTSVGSYRSYIFQYHNNTDSNLRSNIDCHSLLRFSETTVILLHKQVFLPTKWKQETFQVSKQMTNVLVLLRTFCRLHHRSSSFTPVISQSAFVASLPHSSPSDLSYNWRLIVNSFSEVSRSLTLFSFMCFYSIYIFFSCFSFTVTSRTCWVFYFLRFCPPTSRNIKSASWVIRIHCTVAAFMQVKCDLKH